MRKPGDRIERYVIESVLGRGGMGEVRRAEDLRLGRGVAIKILHRHLADDSALRQRFEEEARALAMLGHPNVVAVHDAGEHDGMPFLVLELLPGATLADDIAKGPLPSERVRTIGVAMLAGIEAAHRSGILHRDIKPGNVLMTETGGVKVADFGIAKLLEDTGAGLTTASMVVGTPAYLAPERVQGEPASVLTDIYAVGVVLYEALCGSPPFVSDTPIATARAIVETRAPSLPDRCPDAEPALMSVIERALDRDPAARYPSAASMAAALEGTPIGEATVAVAALPPTAILPAVTADGPPPGPRRGPARLPVNAVAVALVVAFALMVGFALLRPDRASTSTPPSSSTTTNPPAPSATSVSGDLDDALDRLDEAVNE